MNGFLRPALLVILIISIIGIGIELALLEHFESRTQWIPLVLLAVGLLAAILCAARAGRLGLRLLAATMVLFIAAGLVGLYLHYRGNVEFELEMSPALQGRELFVKAMMGATPTLSPGVMIQLGLLGLVYTIKHPGWSKSK